MYFLELPSQPASLELATEECLLEELEDSGQGEELLRIWEASHYCVVVGASSRVAAEVNLTACRSLRLPVCRRISGGCAVVIGPGCLMYSLFISLERRPCLALPQQVHRWVLTRIAETLGKALGDVELCGQSDLAWRGKKFSGNSLRRKRRYLLYHGTLLYAFPLELVDWVLRLPPRQPDWRQGRGHLEFLTNIPLTRQKLRESLVEAWQAFTEWTEIPWEKIRRLAAEKYSVPEWNLRF